MDVAGPVAPNARFAALVDEAPIETSALASYDGGRARTRRLVQSVEDKAFVPGGIDHTLVYQIGGEVGVERYSDGVLDGEVDRLRTTTVIPAGRGYEWRACGPVDVLHAHIDDAVLRQFAERDLGISGDQIEVLDTMGADDGFMRSFAPVLLHEMQSGLPPSRLMVDSLDTVIADHLLRAYSNVGDRVQKALVDPRPTLSDKGIARAREMIEDNLDTGIGIEDLATELGLSTFHVIRAFKAAFGLPPHAYLVQRRIDRACGLLSGTIMSLTKIAGRCGFGSSAHFSTTFRRKMGMTPSDYRRAHSH